VLVGKLPGGEEEEGGEEENRRVRYLRTGEKRGRLDGHLLKEALEALKSP